MSICCFTSATFSYLNRARVCAKSLKAQHPDWTFVLLLTDREPEGFTFDVADEPFDAIKRAEDLGIPDFESWLFKHDVVEVCTAVKGPFLLELVERGFEKVFYLDPDTAVFSPLDELVDALDEWDILLTPHQLNPQTDETSIRDNEIGSLKHGVYNLGFAAVASRGDGVRFAQWWRDRMLAYCYDDISSGLFVDQRWCDLAPAFFERLKVVRDPGCNVASWNLSRRIISINLDGEILVNGSPLKFFHFTKLGALGDAMTERYAKDNLPVYSVWAWYKRQVECATDTAIPKRYWAYGEYADGREIPRAARLLYRNRDDLQAVFPNPFECGAQPNFQEWYERRVDG